jgi:predicted AAA+ superfamily ATPase
VPENLPLESVLSELRKVVRAASSLVIYRGILKDPVAAGMLGLLERIVSDSRESPEYSKNLAEAYALFFSTLSTKATSNRKAPVGNPWQNHLLDSVLTDENVFSFQADSARIGNLGLSLVQQVEEDLRKLRKFYLPETSHILSALRQVSPEGSWVSWDQFHHRVVENNPEESAGTSLKRHLHATSDWSSCVDRLADFYFSTGVGIFSQFRAFRWKPGVPQGLLEGIESVDPIRLEDLVGCDDQKDWLIRNTTHFLAGLPANNVFVYGDRGTGKSSVIKALLHHFALEPLRMLEISREDLTDLPIVMKMLRSRRDYFIVFIDDLSFEEGETQYKTLKAVLEGGLESRPPNVLIYATSNRRHLIREYFSDREAFETGEVRHQDTLQEKISLADRFGIQLVFIAPDQPQYLAIVASMAERRGIKIRPDELNRKALEWAQLHNGRSGRSARQFMDFLTAELKLSNGE